VPLNRDLSILNFSNMAKQSGILKVEGTMGGIPSIKVAKMAIWLERKEIWMQLESLLILIFRGLVKMVLNLARPVLPVRF
jgi:hypothetical protein